MPKCKDCGTELGIYEEGTICPKCGRTYTPQETVKLEGYEQQFFTFGLMLFFELAEAGLLSGGFNQTLVLDDGIIITRLED